MNLASYQRFQPLPVIIPSSLRHIAATAIGCNRSIGQEDAAMQICVIGAGYVGLVTATCFAEMGNQVVCVERDPQRVAMLARGEVPIYEPGLEAMLKAQLGGGQLSFTSQLKAGIRGPR